MKINTQIIRDLNPCESRFNNYLSHYTDFEGDLATFLALDKITYADKVWVVVRLLSTAQRSRWAALCAQSVLHIFESKLPNDSRPRKAVEAVLEGKSKEEVNAAANAARAAADAAHAAADAAYAAAYAVYTAAYAANAANAANAAAYAANAANAAQENKNLQLLLEVVGGVK